MGLYKKVFLGALLSLITIAVKGQQYAHFSQFFLNDYTLNPAVGGTNPYYEVKSTQRYQWLGIEGAPRTFLLSMNGPLGNDGVKSNMGIGGVVYADITGPTRKTGFKLSYSYNFKVTNSIKLSFGIAGGLMQYAVDGSQIKLANQDDQAINNIWQSSYTPDGAFGAYLYHDDFFAGISIPQLIGTNLKWSDGYSSKDNSLKNHYFISGGYTFHLNSDFDIEPLVQLKYIPPTLPQLDIGGRVIWQEMIWLGATYRSGEGASIYTGINFLENFTFGYSYDVITNFISSVSSGTHEVVLGLKFNQKSF